MRIKYRSRIFQYFLWFCYIFWNCIFNVEKAGIKSKNLTIALEPECAAIYCSQISKDQLEIKDGSILKYILAPGSVAMVVDMGGNLFILIFTLIVFLTITENIFNINKIKSIYDRWNKTHIKQIKENYFLRNEPLPKNISCNKTY